MNRSTQVRAHELGHLSRRLVVAPHRKYVSERDGACDCRRAEARNHLRVVRSDSRRDGSVRDRIAWRLAFPRLLGSQRQGLAQPVSSTAFPSLVSFSASSRHILAAAKLAFSITAPGATACVVFPCSLYLAARVRLSPRTDDRMSYLPALRPSTAGTARDAP
eukprot:COSAG02_NODE_5508_length_4271_cov_1.557047_7_plen_162_part_00